MKNFIKYFFELIFFFILLIVAFFQRFRKKKFDVGLGPDPLINNYYHKKALELYGYSSETFVKSSYHITNKFDIDVSKKYNLNKTIHKILAYINLIVITFKYKALYMSFNGGALGLRSIFLWKMEPLIYKIAKIKTVILPYGSDVQDITRSNNLIFKDSIANDYPNQKLNRKIVNHKIDLWTKNADHIIGGCEWVDYMYHWDTLMLAHFSIDINKFNYKNKFKKEKSKSELNILHAPNHKNIKGTFFLIKAVKNLKKEGFKINLKLVEKKSNSEILNLINESDIIADQFVIGWYAMFAIEAMASSKPVLCFLRQDLIDLFTYKELIEKNEIPIINTNIFDLEEKIKWCYQNKDKLNDIGLKGYSFVKKYHSLEAIGKVFNSINKKIDV